MAAEETTNKGNITNNYNAAQTGMNMDNSIGQIKKGMLTYALNANVENFDSNSVNYQNEEGNEVCINFPNGYQVIGNHFIPEKNTHVFFLVDGNGNSQIGYMYNNDCSYRTYLNLACLNFNINHPIQKVVHRITNCTTEIYWTDGYNVRRYLDIQADIPPTNCNELSIQPNFTIPQLNVVDIIVGGQLTAGTYQFAIQYCDALGFGYTSYYSVTNPVSIANNRVVSADFDYQVNQSIRLKISNLEIGGYFEYYNLAVIKDVNAIESVELIGTYYISGTETQITYSGESQTQIRLSINDIFEKFPYYDIAQDVTSVQDILVWDQLTSNDRVNYQSIASQISLKWQTYKLPATENYSNSINTAELRGYLRDEVYAFEIVFLLKNGRQTDGFHIPGRAFITGIDGGTPETTIPNTDPDYIGIGTSSPKWKIYNTAYGATVATGDPINSATPYKYGEFAFWQSSDVYPNNTLVWGSLAGTPIRHHKFPDALVSPVFESANYVGGQPVMQAADAVYPIGVRINTSQVQSLISASGLTQAQKDDIAGFKIVRANRSTHQSIVGKGILRNVGKYTREDTSYYYPNYPYNDLNTDPFLLEKNNAYNAQSILYKLTATVAGSATCTDCYTGNTITVPIIVGLNQICSLTRPVPNGATSWPWVNMDGSTAEPSNPVTYHVVVNVGSTTFTYQNPYNIFQQLTVTVTAGSPQYIYAYLGYSLVDDGTGSKNYTVTTVSNLNPLTLPTALSGFATNESKYRMVFNSPETSFGQPSLGSVLKLENALIGAGQSHFVQVRNNAKYKFLNAQTQKQALDSSYNLAKVTGVLDATAMFTLYQSYLQVYINGITRQNFAYSFNSVANLDYYKDITNSGNKQRELDLCQYINSGVQSVADIYDVNNFQRESSIYLKTKSTNTFLPYPKDVPDVAATGITDNSRFTISGRARCGNPENLESISTVMYYGSLKNIIYNQYGQLYTYQTIDTGFQVDFDTLPGITTVFGGDTFISRFAFKTKLPFFIDNRVGAPDDSDINYDEIGNISYPHYWHSSRSTLYNYWAGQTQLQNIISVKAVSFDCPNDPIYLAPLNTTTITTTLGPGSVSVGSTDYSYQGKFYLFAYGIPFFYCESSINTDLRQAFNDREGDFYPRVSSGIPDSWLQQSVVPIAFDNTYTYNTTYSKQNTDNYFSHLPGNWSNNQCNTVYPFRAIYSDTQSSDPTNKVNNWLIYRPVSFFDFPQNYGNLTSLDGIENKAIIARFDNKSLLYNTMLTIDTSNPQAAYVGNSSLFRSSPPVDFAETDLGYVGSQNKFLLKIPQGQITVDAKRGQIFLISSNGATDITAFGSGINRFMTDHLAFEIIRFFPDADTDNAFSKVGITGVYDSKYDRVIISKLDYIPQPDWTEEIYYDNTPTLNVTCTGKTWYFSNSGDYGSPNETFTYIDCYGVSSTLSVPTGEVYSKCVKTGTTPPVGSQGDTPYTSNQVCTVTKTIPNPNYREYYILVNQVPVVVQLSDPKYFCNKSWTLSFNMNTKSWVSFHSYIPNYYIAENNFFYSGLNQGCNLNFVAAIEVLNPITTTTTSTTISANCQLAGNALLL